jgi:hypothetical protein
MSDITEERPTEIVSCFDDNQPTVIISPKPGPLPDPRPTAVSGHTPEASPLDPEADLLDPLFETWEIEPTVIDPEILWANQRTRSQRMRVGTGIVLLVLAGLATYLNQDATEEHSPPLQESVAVAEQAPDPAIQELGLPTAAPVVSPPNPEPPAAAPEVAEPEPDTTPPQATKARVTSTRSLPPSPAKDISRGWQAIERGDFRAARSSFVEALAIGPSSAEAHYGLGYSAASQGDTSLAMDSYCRALTHAGSDVGLRREVQGLLTGLDGSCP